MSNDTRHPYPEDIYWLIEISDTTLTKDLEEKRLIYAKAGIREYWVIDVEKRQLRVFKGLSKEDYQQEQIYTKGEISPLAFSEIQLLVKSLV